MIQKLLIGLIRLYQKFISPLFPPTCRFDPTCSHYSVEALKEHGALKGSWLSVKRISRCHPFHKGPRYDPVPPARKKKR